MWARTVFCAGFGIEEVSEEETSGSQLYLAQLFNKACPGQRESC